MIRPALALALVVASGSCAAPDEEELPPQPSGPVVYGNFPPIWQRLQVEPQHSLMELLDGWSTLSGMTFTASEATRVRLLSTSAGVLGSTSIQAADVYSWVGGLLVRQGFVMADLTGTDPLLVGIYSTDEIAGAPALAVAPAKLDDYERLPALLVQTTLEFGSDVRTLSNSLRGLAAEGAPTVVPVGNTNHVIVRGTARQVTDTVATLRKIDGQAVRDSDGGADPR